MGVAIAIVLAAVAGWASSKHPAAQPKPKRWYNRFEQAPV